MTGREDLADLAEAMVPVATRLVGAVHFEGVGAVGRVLAGLSEQQRTAVTVILAAMVNPDRTASELLAWTEVGTPEPQPSLFDGVDLATDPRTWPDEVVRQLAAEAERTPTLARSLADSERLRLGSREWARRRRERNGHDSPSPAVVR